MVCKSCWLVQTEDHAKAEIFLVLITLTFPVLLVASQACKNYSKVLTETLGLRKSSFVIEVASNDGYLLKNFVNSGIPCLGIEPIKSTAMAAEKLGVPVLQEFFGEEIGTQLAAEGKKADLVIGNNVWRTRARY